MRPAPNGAGRIEQPRRQPYIDLAYSLYRLRSAIVKGSADNCASVEDVVQRLTKPTARVLTLLLEAEGGQAYGLEIAKGAQVGPGTLYPMLTRLESVGWVDSSWEDIDPADEGRPARRYYTLTAQGRLDARAILDDRGTLGDGNFAQA